MALNFSRFNFFQRLDARGRIFFLFASLVLITFIIYVAVRFFWAGGQATGASSVAGVPAGVQSIPGGEVSPEYAKALQQANVQAAQQAQMTVTSAIPTMVNVAGTSSSASCIICAEDATNVKYKLTEWIQQGKISPEVADALQQLADKNVSIEEYAQQLDQLVKDGKLTPEQARELLELYKKQRASALLKDSAKLMDSLITSGNLPLDIANQLLTAQKDKLSVADYAALLQDMLKQGRISPATAQQLLAQYAQQKAKEATLQGLANLRRMAQAGEITADVEKTIADLETRNVPFDTYSKTLDQLVKDGKLTPASATKLLDRYKSQKTAIGPIASLNELLQQAEAAANAEIADLLKQGKITSDVAAILADL